MAIFRKIHTSFWSDSFISDLPNDRKLFYLYLLTNERTSQCGIYEITKKQMSFDLGCSIDTVSKQLEYFSKQLKIKYNDTTKEIAIKNWNKFNKSTSPKVKSCVDKELKIIKDTSLIQYIYSIDTASQEEEEQEQEEEQEIILLSELKSSDRLNKNQEIAYKFWLLFKKTKKELGIEKTKTLDSAKLQSWENDIRLLFEVDKRTKEDLASIYNFLKDESLTGKFSWRKNVFSTSKIRENFEKLIIPANEQSITKKKKPTVVD